MRQRVLDTNILINHWGYRRTRARRTIAQLTVDVAVQWGHELESIRGSNLILTPICIEYLCGRRSPHEMDLAKAFLSAFHVADEGRIFDEDWEQALRIASRIPRDGAYRQLGDCLIRAISRRLRLDVDTDDARFPVDA